MGQSYAMPLARYERLDVALPNARDYHIPIDVLLTMGQGADESTERLESCDLLLFEGTGFWGRIIQFFTRCRYSHIGIVVRDPSDGTLYLLESPGHRDNIVPVLPIAQSETTPTLGVRLVLLRDRLEQYCRDAPHWMSGQVNVCLVHVTLDPPYTRAEATLALIKFAHRACGHHYDDSAVHFVRNSFPSLVGPDTPRVDRLSSYTCTQLVAAALQEVRVLNAWLPIASIQTPRQFIDGTITPDYWLNGRMDPHNLHLTLKAEND